MSSRTRHTTSGVLSARGPSNVIEQLVNNTSMEKKSHRCRMDKREPSMRHHPLYKFHHTTQPNHQIQVSNKFQGSTSYINRGDQKQLTIEFTALPPSEYELTQGIFFVRRRTTIESSSKCGLFGTINVGINGIQRSIDTVTIATNERKTAHW